MTEGSSGTPSTDKATMNWESEARAEWCLSWVLTKGRQGEYQSLQMLCPQDNLLRYMLKNRETRWELPYLGNSYFASTVSHHQTYLSRALSSPKDSVQTPDPTFKAVLLTLHKTCQASVPLLPSPILHAHSPAGLLGCPSLVPISAFLCLPEKTRGPPSRVYMSPSLFLNFCWPPPPKMNFLLQSSKRTIYPHHNHSNRERNLNIFMTTVCQILSHSVLTQSHYLIPIV